MCSGEHNLYISRRNTYHCNTISTIKGRVYDSICTARGVSEAVEPIKKWYGNRGVYLLTGEGGGGGGYILGVTIVTPY